MTYKHLNHAERYQIRSLIKAYRPKHACDISGDRAQNSRNAPTVEAWVREATCALLCIQLSPNQIASK